MLVTVPETIECKELESDPAPLVLGEGLDVVDLGARPVRNALKLRVSLALERRPHFGYGECRMIRRAPGTKDSYQTGERGADAICTYADPLGVVHRLAVQIKMWSWDADWTRPLDQLRQAYGAYDRITGGVILSTSERVSDRFEARRRDLETELHMPIRVILRSELIRLFVTHLPVLMDG